jgi:hypothetical protein
MFKIGDKEFSDEEVGLDFWKKVKARMESCRSMATDYYNNLKKDGSYRIDYIVDPGRQSAYVRFSDEDYKIIKKELDEYIAECSKYDDMLEREDFFKEEARKWDIYWEKYIPDVDLHWAGGDPVICDVDLEDVKYCYVFQVTNIKGGNEEKRSKEAINIELSEDEYISLLASRLFDSKLCFSDLRVLNPELYERIDNMVRRTHCDYYVEMEEINGAAKEIMDHNEGYKELPKLEADFFTPFIIHEILNNKEKYSDDAYLFKAFRLAITT